jgi:hypothetical protein
MFQRMTLLVGFLLVMAFPGGAQTAKPSASSVDKRNSGPLAWVSSDVNPKTVFWIQGRFVPVDDPKYEGTGAEVATIVCLIREHECLEIDSTSDFANMEQAWIEEFKPVTWDGTGVIATGRSLDGCTDETLRVHFNKPSVVIVNSPVLPMPERCKDMNKAMDTLAGKKGLTLKGQMGQDMLVPTRAFMPFQDVGKSPDK